MGHRPRTASRRIHVRVDRDLETGEPLAVLDLAWPNGLQEGFSQAVPSTPNSTVAEKPRRPPTGQDIVISPHIEPPARMWRGKSLAHAGRQLMPRTRATGLFFSRARSIPISLSAAPWFGGGSPTPPSAPTEGLPVGCGPGEPAIVPGGNRKTYGQFCGGARTRCSTSAGLGRRD